MLSRLLRFVGDYIATVTVLRQRLFLCNCTSLYILYRAGASFNFFIALVFTALHRFDLQGEIFCKMYCTTLQRESEAEVRGVGGCDEEYVVMHTRQTSSTQKYVFLFYLSIDFFHFKLLWTLIEACIFYFFRFLERVVICHFHGGRPEKNAIQLGAENK